MQSQRPLKHQYFFILLFYLTMKFWVKINNYIAFPPYPTQAGPNSHTGRSCCCSCCNFPKWKALQSDIKPLNQWSSKSPHSLTYHPTLAMSAYLMWLIIAWWLLAFCWNLREFFPTNLYKMHKQGLPFSTYKTGNCRCIYQQTT